MTTTITAGIHYVGVNDRNKQLFEGLWPLPDGVSYNSYIISDDKTVLIDTVEVDFFMQFLENIREAIGDRTTWNPTTAARWHCSRSTIPT